MVTIYVQDITCGSLNNLYNNTCDKEMKTAPSIGDNSNNRYVKGFLATELIGPKIPERTPHDT